MVREDRRVYVSSGSLSPDEVAGRTFALTFRGFDTTEVRTYLGRMADELRRAAERERELRRLLAEAEDRAAHPELDEPTLTRALGQEAARLLQTAHEAAADVKARAEESVARLLREAHEQANEIRTAAETVLGERTTEAEEAAAKIRGAAEGEVAAVMDDARREAEAMLEPVRAQCRDMLEEAQDLRGKVLNDLARRRKVVHTQVEQLRAGRDSLVDSFREVRRSLDHINDELQRAEGEARQAAESAVRRVSEEREPTADDLERALPSDAHAAPAGPPVVAVVPGPGAEEAAEELGAEPAPSSAPAAAAHSGPVTAVSAPTGATEERRLSSLRILRRPRRAEVPPPPPGMTEVKPPSEDEGVRVLDEGASAPVAPLTEEAETAGEVAGVAVDAAETAETEGARDKGGGRPASRRSADDIFARMRAAQEESGDHAEAETPTDGESAAQAPAAPEAEPPAVAQAEGNAGAAPPESAAAVSEPAAAVAGEAAEEGEPEENESLRRRRDELVEPIQQQAVRKLKRLVQDEQNDVLDRLRSYRGKPSVEVLLLSEEAQTARYVDAMRPLLEQAAAAGARFGAELQQREPATSEPAGVEEVARDLAATVGTAIRRRLERAAEQGSDDEASMSETVGAAYREWKGKRADRVAGDHLAAAFARGVMVATDDGGFLRWVVDDGEDRCPDCDDNALGGPTERGDPYPTGHTHPPAHPGCRCILVPASP
jgi:DivIVA domain-containing protein